RLEPALRSLAEDLRERTTALFGFPDGDRIDFELVRDQPWAGFNYYLGGLRSRVAINVDLPVLSTSLAHLVAHEAYPGHHTEHSRKEVRLVQRKRQLEETIFLVGTPSALLAEHLGALGIRFDSEVVAAVSEAGEALAAVRGNAALRLHEDGADPDTVIEEVARWGMLPRARAAKAVEFLLHPTWRAYVFCYIEGLRLCRRFVGGDPARFARLVTEQLVPADLAA